MEVHYLIDHNVARTTLQPLGENCQVCSGGWSAKLPHPYKPLGFLAEPLLHHQQPFCFYQPTTLSSFTFHI
jgi:hypothetical protein